MCDVVQCGAVPLHCTLHATGCTLLHCTAALALHWTLHAEVSTHTTLQYTHSALHYTIHTALHYTVHTALHCTTL